MTSKAERAVGALRTGFDTLAELIGSLPPEDLVRPSAASEWKVADVLSHLGSGSVINLAALEGALDGSGLPPADFNTNTWDRWNAMSPAEQAENFLSAGRTLIERYEALTDEQLTDLRIDLGYMPEPVDVATAAGARLNEFALHSWDVRVALDPEATLAPEATEILLETIPRLLGWAAKADQYDGEAILTVTTTEPARSYTLAITDSVQLTESPTTPATDGTTTGPATDGATTGPAADGALTVPAEFLIRLVTGRNAERYTPASVTLTGDKVTLDDLRKVFPGF
ncbi:maleylpyruvate isomerase family mycothiol-dependent enzyme [Kribbella sp. NPDC051770]|uniref:maleylpyruvate isomerase family mycothiol-dependent enzyme n=1 Tax=Kribbella sp. NPDC051770 TaxID=3155413 RepID=UPI003445B1B2